MSNWVIGLFGLLCAMSVSFAGEARRWDFEGGASGWKATENTCGIVAEAGSPQNHVYQITASKPHHTRIVLEGSAATPDFLATLRVRVLTWTGAPPVVYVYGRCGAEGFRALALDDSGARVFSYFGRERPAVQLGSLGAGLSAAPTWVRIAFGCFGDYVFAKTWPADSPEPAWQVESRAPRQGGGEFALGVWTSPKVASTATVLFDDVQFTPLASDMLGTLGIKVGPTPALDLPSLPKSPGVFEAPDRIGLLSSRTAIAFARDTGRITNLVDLPSGREFVSPDCRLPIFSLTLTQPYEGKRGRVTSRDFRKIALGRAGREGLFIQYDDCPSYPLQAHVSVSIVEDTIRLKVGVRNQSDWCVAGIVFPQMRSPAQLGETDARMRPMQGIGGIRQHPGDEENSYLLPWAGGAVLPNPGGRSAAQAALYPGSAFTQFYALYDSEGGRIAPQGAPGAPLRKTAGLYVGAHDPGGHCKQFRLECCAGMHSSLTIEHLFPELPRQEVKLPYDVVVRTFKGDWRDAADIYKAWAVKSEGERSDAMHPLAPQGAPGAPLRQPWCAKRLSEREDVPLFLKDGAGIIITGIQNPQGRARRFGESMEKLPELLNAYRDHTGLKHMIFVPYGWENRGTWAGINYFPAVPSDECWRKTSEILKGLDHRLAFLTSGFWWVVKRQKTSEGAAFDDSPDFERRRGMCIQNPDGTPWLVDWYNRTKEFGSWRGLSAALCHGSKEARDTLKRIFLDTARLGVPLISFDQEIGGSQAAPCYSRTHGHPPGFGDWMWTSLRDLCAEILKEGKPIQPELGLFMENESELAIPYMATYWSRQFGEVDVGVQGGRGVGLFSYLYHEYVTCIGAACVQGQGELARRPDPRLRCYILANNLVRGLIQGPFMHDVPLEGGNEWERATREAYQAFCRPYRYFPEYLMLGKSCRPPAIECENVKVWYWKRGIKKDEPVKTFVSLPAVTSGSFEAPDGSVATFVANTTPEARKAEAKLPQGKGVTICRADRTTEGRAEGDTVSLNLEPFGVRVLLAR